MRPKNTISDYGSQRGGNVSVENELAFGFILFNLFIFFIIIIQTIPMSTGVIELGGD
jgi:hypothetical protein